MGNSANPRPAAVWLLILLLVLLGVGALAGGGMLAVAPDGHLLQMPLDMLQHSPFPNFLIPGILLLLFLGIYPLAVAYSLWKCPPWGWPALLNPFRGIHWSWAGSLAAGVIVLVWIIVEMLMLRAIHFLHVLYFVWGILLVLLTLVPRVRRHYALPG